MVGEKGVLPQRAKKVDPSLPLRDGELLIDVESLNIDAASFKQLKEAGQIEQLGAARGAKYRLTEQGRAAVESQAGEDD